MIDEYKRKVLFIAFMCAYLFLDLKNKHGILSVGFIF